MEQGRIVQVMGPVVDVEFENCELPEIKDALEVDNDGKRCVMEVAQHIGNLTGVAVMSGCLGLYAGAYLLGQKIIRL